MDLGERLKDLREINNLTQRVVAEKIGVSFQSIQKYENGSIKDIPVSRILAFCELYNVTPNYLLGWEEDYNSGLKDIIYKKLAHASDEDIAKVLQILDLIISDE